MENIAEEILEYNKSKEGEDRAICELLAKTIHTHLPEATNKLWHGHPVWFLDGNPITGYDKLKNGVRLMFWSGADFGEDDLAELGSKFKDASIRYHSVAEINIENLQRWLSKSRDIQWDYKNIVKRKGKLERLK
ncbi:protein of unknown function (DU1801) [Parapedobacter composti]|uniref:YdhG-like domain-containing protein n=1 Tax=Parapedobacter composti TaxID=623281 RepID=A0A1I1I3N7_9SPHI|nr:DUF1801 domain-containing protein [Parapedobacter composti]SFC30412.1 protein of unknown function (DU1801) [Parapedobacter composti]